MEYIILVLFFIAWLAGVIFWCFAAHSLYMLITNIKPDKKWLCYVAGPFLLVLPGAYNESVSHFIPRFWKFSAAFIITCLSILFVGKTYFPAGFAGA